MEDIKVNYAKIIGFKMDNEKESIVVLLNSSMIDYIIDEDTKKVLKGSKTKVLTNTYKLTFIRKKGYKTTSNERKINCPNCGAFTKITSSGRCEYCNSVITTGEHDWVLNDIERM